jgi:hypothetical protein
MTVSPLTINHAGKWWHYGGPNNSCFIVTCERGESNSGSDVAIVGERLGLQALTTKTSLPIITRDFM